MKRTLLCAALTLVIAFGFGVNSANALLILSGDSNIIDPIYGGQGQAIDAGNQQFFTNILLGGTTVKVLNSTVYGGWATGVNIFYDSISGVTSTIVSGAVTASTLTDVDLFVAPVPEDAFSSDEISVFSNYLSGGGSLFLLGEHSGSSTWNGYINSLLTGIDSGLSIVPNTVFDIGAFTEASSSQIATDTLTSGVNTFSYTAPSEVSGGTPLFFGTDGQTFLAYETTSVPEPSTLILLGVGLIGLAGFRRKFAGQTTFAK